MFSITPSNQRLEWVNAETLKVGDSANLCGVVCHEITKIEMYDTYDGNRYDMYVETGARFTRCHGDVVQKVTGHN